MTESKKKPLKLTFSGTLFTVCVGFVVYTLPPYLLWHWLKSYNPVYGLILAGSATVFFGFVQAGVNIFLNDRVHQLVKNNEMEEEIGFGLASLIAFIFNFSFFCFSLNHLNSSNFACPQPENVWAWIIFSTDTFINSILFGIPETYDKHFSEIKPNLTLAKTVMLIFRLIAEFVLIVSVYRIIGLIRNGVPAGNNAG